MNVNNFDKIISQFTTQIQQFEQENTSKKSQSRLTNSLLVSISHSLSHQLNEFEQLDSQSKLKGGSKEWLALKSDLENLEIAIQAKDLAKDPSMAKTMQSLVKVKRIADLHLAASTANAGRVSAQAKNDLPKIAEQLRQPPSKDPGQEIQNSLRLVGQLKELRRQINALNLDDLHRYPELKIANQEIEKLLATAQRKLDSSQVGLTRAEEVANKIRLENIRQEAFKKASTGNIPAEQISHEISQGIAEFVKSLYSDGIKQLGEPPCDYCITVFGSLARQESGPYPDLDHMIVIKDKTPETIHYFTKLNQYVADRFHRLGESEELGKAGLRFCPGNLNPDYLRYDFRYSESSRTDYILSIMNPLNEKREAIAKSLADIHGARAELVKARSEGKPTSELEDNLKKLEDEQKELADKLNSFASSVAGKKVVKKREDLKKVTFEIAKVRDAYRLKPDLKLIDKLIKLGAEQEALIADLLSLSEEGPAKDISKKREKLTKITNEIDDLLAKITAKTSTVLEEKLKQLQIEQEKLVNEIEMDESRAHGGTPLFFTEPLKTDVTVVTAKEKESIKNQIIKENVEFIQDVASDSLPIMGNAALYTEYMSLRNAALTAAVPAASVVTKQSAVDAIKRQVTEIQETIAPFPFYTLDIPELVHVKNDMYRFPQVIAAKLADIKGVKNTNTFERIRALRDEGVFDNDFANRLLLAMDQLVRLRILAQTSHGQEYEFVSTGDWDSFSKKKEALKKETEELQKILPDLKAKKEKFEAEIKDLKIKATAGDDAAKKALPALEAQLKVVEKDLIKGEFFELLLKVVLPKVEKKEYKIDPANARRKVKEPVIPAKEIERLRKETLPTLHELFERADKSISGGAFDITAFHK